MLFGNIKYSFCHSKRLLNLIKTQSSRYTVNEGFKKRDDGLYVATAFNHQSQKFVDLMISNCQKDHFNERIDFSSEKISKETLLFLNSHLKAEQLLVDIENNMVSHSQQSLLHQERSSHIYLLEEREQQILHVEEEEVLKSEFEEEDFENRANGEQLNSESERQSLYIQISLDQFTEEELGKIIKLVNESQEVVTINLAINQKIEFTEKQAENLCKLLEQHLYNKKLNLILINASIKTKEEQASWVSIITRLNRCKKSLSVQLRFDNPEQKSLKMVSTLLSNCSLLTTLTLQIQNTNEELENLNIILERFSKTSSLKQLILHLSEISLVQLPSLLLSVNSCSHLKSLSLNLNQLSKHEKKPKKDQHGYSSYLRNLDNIKSLSIKVASQEEDFEINEIDVQRIFSMIKRFTHLDALCLDLSNSLNIDGFDEMYDRFETLSNKQLASLKRLNLILKNTNLNDFEAGDIGEIIQGFSELKKLKLDVSQNQIELQGFTNIFQGLYECQNLIDLDINLQNNKIQIKDYEHQFQEAPINNQIEKFNLSIGGNKIDDKDEHIILDWIKSIENLRAYKLLMK